MTVIKNQKSNTYEVRTYYKDWTGVRKQKTKRGFKRKCDAQEWERAFKLKENLSLDMYFEDFVDLYLNDIKSRIKYNTWLTKKHIVEKKILPYFSKKKLQEIKPSDIRQWQNTMMNYRNKQGEGYSQVYLKTIHNQLSAILNHAVNFYDLKSNAARKAGSMGKERTKEMLFWTKEEYMKFIVAVADKPISFYAFEILYWCGVRMGELLALTPADFDFQACTIRINKSYQRLEGKDIITDPKTVKSNRMITMPEFLSEELESYIGMLYGLNENDRIFQISKSYLHHEMDRGVKLSGVKRIRIHDLRHSHVSLLINMGYSAVAITEFLEEPDIRGGSDSESESIDGDNMLFIKPDEANAIILKKGVAVTGYGIVEGKLHIQVRFSDILNTDNHGYVYLKNEDGKVVNCQSSVAFWDQSHVNSYEEFVFEVSAEELVNYEIWGEFWTCNNAPIEGEWQVTFPVEKNE